VVNHSKYISARAKNERRFEENTRRTRGEYVREKQMIILGRLLGRLLVIWGGRGDLPVKFPVYK
jgi:hypothetical protein